jgi:hypothetical protein
MIDNFSRRILAWRVAETFAPVNGVAVLLDASRAAAPSETTPVVLADAGVENVNAQVDDLITTGVLRRVLAFTELKFSNSMIEAWWGSLKHQMALPPLAGQRHDHGQETKRDGNVLDASAVDPQFAYLFASLITAVSLGTGFGSRSGWRRSRAQCSGRPRKSR